jgi:hypothetical protein
MEFKVVKKVIKVVVGDETYMVSKPTVSQIEALSKKESNVGTLVEFLAELGLPKQVTYDFELDSLNELVALLMPQEKKS